MSKLDELLKELDERNASASIAYIPISKCEYDLLRAALRERAGMVMVPPNPTHSMLDAGRKASDFAVSNIMLDVIYRAMLAAAESK